MSECTHDCSSCGSSCGERTEPQSLLQPLNSASRVGKVIAVVSGKGGVGKSMVTSMLAVLMQRRGYKTAILDADITGPSIPKAFNIHGNCFQSENGIEPLESHTGIKVMSINLLLEKETEPVVWRGPVIAGRRQPVLDGCALGRCGLYVRRYASRNGRRAADGVPVAAGGRHHRRCQPAGARRHDRGKGGQHGRR